MKTENVTGLIVAGLLNTVYALDFFERENLTKTQKKAVKDAKENLKQAAAEINKLNPKK